MEQAWGDIGVKVRLSSPRVNSSVSKKHPKNWWFDFCAAKTNKKLLYQAIISLLYLKLYYNYIYIYLPVVAYKCKLNSINDKKLNIIISK